MYEKLKDSRKVVGTRRLIRAIQAGEVSEVYLAGDADLFIVRQVKDAAAQAGLRVVQVDTKKELGALCGVEVKTAAAGILR
ncbi:MAG: ribosomal L7Ae/L30e/S12e/Gadd45 family protein [Clostridia bacterium]|nr:ribosomal L7Ae/L30e/S12e/Gadd45 family protein [Clostridia bacterium]MBQ8972667.1 ribosomal L7Ae/L30e/S12e/Gadd45 family protein [Clostridia bacterium]